MKTNRPLFFLIVTVLLAAMLVSCNSGDKNADDQTTQATVTTSPNTQLVPHATALVANPGWGYEAMSVGTSAPTVVSATLMEGGNVEIVSYNPGKAEVYVYDCFGHKAIIEVTVADDEERSLFYKANPCVEEFINAADFGVTPNAPGIKPSDKSKQMQAAIDYAYNQGGGTVYLYPGIYQIDFIHIRDNVTLEMYSGYTDATKGITAELTKAIKDGTVTVLKGTRIMNNKNNDYGRNGASNFAIRGGVLDNGGSTRTILLFAHATNVRLENLIVKDIKNDHMLQITGCTDVEVKNCIFAGFAWGGTFTREVIQIEPSTPDSFGSNPSSTPQRFDKGEFVCPKDVTIDGCYFGPSDKQAGPHIAIGHHGYAHEANCEDLVITNNVFDRCSYSAIRFANLVDVEIKGNKFIATKDTNKLCSEDWPAFIIIFSYKADVTYYNIVDGKKITKALDNEQSGSHNLYITDNEFLVEKGSDKKIIIVEGRNHTPGAVYKTNVLRQDKYNSTPYTISGYFKTTNYVGNLNFNNNKVVYEGQPTVSDNIFYFNYVFGLSFKDNDIELKNGCLFTESGDGINGLSLNRCHYGEDAETYKITMEGTDCHIELPSADGSAVKLRAGKTYPLTLIATEGGRIEITSDTKGNIAVKVIANEGYTFAGWKDGVGADFKQSGDFTVSSALTLKAIFNKVN